MKILNARIRWNDGFSNDPTLEILVDKIPERSSMRYERKENLYFAELGGFVSFFCYDEPGDGYAGAEFELDVIGEGKKTLVGPWSSRPGVMNQKGFEPSMDVSLTDNPQAFERGYTFMGAHITVEKAKEALRYIQGSSIIRVVRNYGTVDEEPVYIVTKVGEPDSIEVVASRKDF